MKKIHTVDMSDIEDLIISKYFIEEELLKTNVISEKMKLNEFVTNFIDISRNYIVLDIHTDPVMIPIFIYNDLKNDIYIFFSTKNERCDEVIKLFKNINFDFNKLTTYVDQNILLKYKNKEYSFK